MRNAYIARQRADHGRKILGVLPVHYPKPLLTAMNLLAVEIWGPPGPPRGAQAGRLQPYICAIARNALAFIASGGAEAVDAFLVPHTCDSLQGLATLLPDFGGTSQPVLCFQHPKGEARPSARAFMFQELKALAASLERLTGEPVHSDRLLWALGLHREIDALRAQLLSHRAQSPLDDPTLYRLLRRGEHLWPEDYLRELREAAALPPREPPASGLPLLVSGYVPEPMEWLEQLGALGAFVAADDYAAIGRRIPPAAPPMLEDPWEELSLLQFAGPPCPTRGAPLSARLAHLESLWRSSGAAGVILHTLKFCEPELFDVPAIRQHFAQLGASVLQIESELEDALSGQTVTRLEAFLEMLESKRRRS